MSSTYSTSLRLEMPATGDQSGTWGDTVNRNFGTLVEHAVAGYVQVTMANSNYTLTTANGTTDEARRMLLKIVSSASLTTTRNVVCPTASKLYFVQNSTTGGQSIVFTTSAGSGVTIPNGRTAAVYCDGTNVLDAVTMLPTGATLAGDAIVSLAATQTLTNKSLTSPTLTGVVTIPLGSVAAPSVAFTGSSGTDGIYSGGAGTIGFSGLSTQLGYLTASIARFTGLIEGPDGTASTPGYRYINDADTGMFRATTNTLAFTTGGSERVRITSSGQLVVGGTSGVAPLTVSTSSVYAITGAFAGATNATDWATGFAPTSVNASGVFAQAVVADSVYAASDRRLKTDIEDINLTDANAFVQNAAPVSFRWASTGKHDTGFVAQQLISAGFGAFVSAIPDPTMMATPGSPEGQRYVVKYDSVVPVLCAAIKGLLARVEVLEAKGG